LQKDVISLSTLLSFFLDDKLSYLKFDKSVKVLGWQKVARKIEPRSLQGVFVYKIVSRYFDVISYHIKKFLHEETNIATEVRKPVKISCVNKEFFKRSEANHPKEFCFEMIFQVETN
jgi:hypothetical protein